ncbi:MAG TPA: alpha/beta hydrolase [Thermoanaerobaculia bacterium]|nr:alpha/beta hydrolase [Thermoanaerobaculia bacterium]
MGRSFETIDGWRASGRTFRHGGRAVFYQDAGVSGAEVLLCMHGFPTASWDWHRLWPELCARWRVIAPDMLGYGFSDKPVAYDYSLVDQADIVEKLLDALAVRRVHLLAHDVGDSVAQELLARHAERVNTSDNRLTIGSVCMLNGGVIPEAHRPTFTQRLLASPLGFLVGRLMTERRFCASISVVFGANTKPSAAELAELWSLVAFNGGQRIAHKLIGYMAERRRQRDRWVGALRSSVPLRMISGLDDPVSGARMVARLREEVPDVDVVSLPGIGHYPQLEDPAGVLRAYFEFRTALRSRQI